MKKFLLVLVCLAVGLFTASVAMGFTAAAPGAGINASPHDLSITGPVDYSGGSDPYNRICIFCHAPHNTYRLAATIPGSATSTGGDGPIAPDAYDYLPLWNHLLPAVTSYNLYYPGPGAPDYNTSAKGPQALFFTTGRFAPGGSSLLCFSCHDGLTAINTYGDILYQPVESVKVGATTMPAGFIIGKNNNLQNHHPIAFEFTAQMGGFDPGITDPILAEFNTGDLVQNHLYSYTDGITTYTNQMECGTCHSVHNTANSGERLLWRSDTSSALCLTCHIKGTLPAPGGASGEVTGRTY
jgi:predicted CXXCH cytochrome family protein